MSGFLSIELKLPFDIEKKNKWFIATCPLLDINTQGESRKIAKDNLAEAINLFVLNCLEMGTLEEVLNESGFKKFDLEPISEPTHNIQTINVPIHSISTQNRVKRSQTCHA